METSEKNKKAVKSRRFRLRVGPSTRLVLIAAIGAAVPTACLLVLASRPGAAGLCIPIAVAAGLAFQRGPNGTWPGGKNPIRNSSS